MKGRQGKGHEMRKPTKPDVLDEALGKIEHEYETKRRRMESLRPAYVGANLIGRAWAKKKAGRDVSVWVWEGSFSLQLQLAPDDIFGDAEEAFCRLQESVTENMKAIGMTSSTPWSDVSDQSSEQRAAKSSSVIFSKGDDFSLYNFVTLGVFAIVGDGSACTVVRAGTRQETDYGASWARPTVTRPVFKAVCPGDPL